MGWCTELFCNIYFNKETFNHINQVNTRIDEVNKDIQDAENRLRQLVFMTEPNKFFEGEDIAYQIEEMFNECIEVIKDNRYELTKLEFLKENWNNCHDRNGLAINPPENIMWDTAYLDGDYVKSIKNPSGN